MPHNPRSNRRPSCSSRTIRSSSPKTIGDTLKADSAMRLTSRAPRSGWSAGPENAAEPSGDGGRRAGPWVSAGIAAHRAAGRPRADGPGYPRYRQRKHRDGQRVPRRGTSRSCAGAGRGHAQRRCAGVAGSDVGPTGGDPGGWRLGRNRRTQLVPVPAVQRGEGDRHIIWGAAGDLPSGGFGRCRGVGHRRGRHAVRVAGLVARHDFRPGDDVVAQGAAGVSRIWTYHPDVCGVPSSRELSTADLRRAARRGVPFSVALIALQDEAGSGKPLPLDAPAAAAHWLRECLRGSDYIGRLEESRFALVLPETWEEDARIVLARIDGSFRYEAKTNGGKERWLTCRVGVATWTPENPDAWDGAAKRLEATLRAPKQHSSSTLSPNRT